MRRFRSDVIRLMYVLDRDRSGANGDDSNGDSEQSQAYNTATIFSGTKWYTKWYRVEPEFGHMGVNMHWAKRVTRHKDALVGCQGVRLIITKSCQSTSLDIPDILDIALRAPVRHILSQTQTNYTLKCPCRTDLRREIPQKC